MKLKVSRREEIKKSRAKINEIETEKTIEKINKANNQFFEKINRIGRSVFNQTQQGKSIEVLSKQNQKCKGNIINDTLEKKGHKRSL